MIMAQAMFGAGETCIIMEVATIEVFEQWIDGWPMSVPNWRYISHRIVDNTTETTLGYEEITND